jgi:CheY-like chemotaxis protein
MSKSILLAEDDRFLRRACETKLKQAGFDVRVAVDGEEALTFVREKVPDLLLLDLLMPKRDGLSVLATPAATPRQGHPRRDHVELVEGSRTPEGRVARRRRLLDQVQPLTQELCDRSQLLNGPK